jgi:hypothetical protein
MQKPCAQLETAALFPARGGVYKKFMLVAKL